jgi:hypothetical protein
MRWKLAILLWMIISLSLQVLIRVTSIAYDSGGLSGLAWWTTQAIIAPVTILSEALRFTGLRTTGFEIYILLTVFIGILGIVIAHYLRSKRSDG